MKYRISLIFFLLLAFGVFLGAPAQDVLADDAPVIYVEEPDFNFGTRAPGEPVEHDFVIENRGSAPLSITQSYSSCGCTVANADPSEVLPGETSSLHVKFSTRGRSGPQSKKVYIVSNDPVTPRLECSISGELA